MMPVTAGLSEPVAWFARGGLALSAAEAALIDRWRHAHPQLAGAGLAGVAHWWEAGEIARAMDHDGVWWNVEEEERERLWQVAADRLGEPDLVAELAVLHARLAPGVEPAVREVMANASITDPGLAQEAVAAALLALHQDALARLAGAAPDHFFRLKLALFVAGRWPLGLHRGACRAF